MRPHRHLLVGTEPTPLPRWKEAFPDGEYALLSDEISSEPKIVWLWLRIDQPSSPQIASLVRKFPGVPKVVLTNLPMADDAITCLKSGIRAYSNAQSGPQTLKQIAQAVEAGGIWLGEDLAQYLLTHLGSTTDTAKSAADASLTAGLSRREMEVAESVADGASNKIIARRLGITERTVKAHVTAILQKLGVHDRLQLALKFQSVLKSK